MVHEALNNREAVITPSTETLQVGAAWLALRPLAIRFDLAGLHTFRIMVDDAVAGDFDLTVVYERLPYGEPPL